MIGLPMEALLAAQTSGFYGVTDVEIQHYSYSYFIKFTYSINNRKYYSGFELEFSDISNLTLEEFKTILDIHTKHYYNMFKDNHIVKKGENT